MPQFNYQGAKSAGYSDAEIASFLKNYAPPVDKPGLPQDKQEYQGMSYGSELPIPSSNFATDGAKQMYDGAAHMTQPGISPKLGGASQVMRGAGQIASPVAAAMFGPALVAAPAATVGGLLGGGAGAAVGKYGSQALGANEDIQNFSTDMGGLLGAGLGAKAGTAARDAVRFIQKNRSVQDSIVGGMPILGKWANNVRNSVDAARAAETPTVAAAQTPQPGYTGPGERTFQPLPPPVPKANPVTASGGLLDDIAKGQAGKPFAKLDPGRQALVRSIAEGIAPPPLPKGGLLSDAMPTPAPKGGLLGDATDFKTKATARGIADKFIGGSEESGLIHGSNVTTKNQNLVDFAKSQGLPAQDFTEEQYNMLVDGFNQSKKIDPATGKPFRYTRAGTNNGPKQHGRSVADTLRHFNEEYLR